MRKRGVILTKEGFSKLEQAKSAVEKRENAYQRFTLEALSLRTGLDPDTVMKVLKCEVGVDKRSLNICFKAFDIQLSTNDYQLASLNQANSCQIDKNRFSKIENQIDFGEAPDVSAFCGRTEELVSLQKWIVDERCRSVMLLGMGGIGKTWLSVKLAQENQNQFDFVIWRSLRNSPPVKEILEELLQLLPTELENDSAQTEQNLILRLINYFKRYRCLLILDNLETILSGSEYNPSCYCKGYEGYGQLFRLLGETSHQSCLLLTTREKPTGFGRLEGEKSSVRVMQVKGLQPVEVKQILQTKGDFRGSAKAWNQLVERFGGNPLLLNIASRTIQNIFDGKIQDFLTLKASVFGDIRFLLQQHYKRLSAEEKDVVNWLAINHQPISFTELKDKISYAVPAEKLLEVLESLQERSLIEKKATRFCLQPLVKEYISSSLVQIN